MDTVNYVRFLKDRITMVVATATAVARFNMLIKDYLSSFKSFYIAFFTYLYFQVVFMLIALRAKKASDVD